MRKKPKPKKQKKCNGVCNKLSKLLSARATAGC